MVKQCELCELPARTHCESDGASLCWRCDARVHGANFLVARHPRSLLCRSCQAPTPWCASGARLADATFSLCERCLGARGGCGMMDDKRGDQRALIPPGRDGGDDQQEVQEDDGGDEETEGDEDDDEGGDEEDEDDQVVPLAMEAATLLPRPPVASYSSSEQSSSHRRPAPPSLAAAAAAASTSRPVRAKVSSPRGGSFRALDEDRKPAALRRPARVHGSFPRGVS